jgi:hypothetical protein
MKRAETCLRSDITIYSKAIIFAAANAANTFMQDSAKVSQRCFPKPAGGDRPTPRDMFVVGIADPAKFIVPQRILDSNSTTRCQVPGQARLL